MDMVSSYNWAIDDLPCFEPFREGLLLNFVHLCETEPVSFGGQNDIFVVGIYLLSVDVWVDGKMLLHKLCIEGVITLGDGLRFLLRLSGVYFIDLITFLHNGITIGSPDQLNHRLHKYKSM